VHTQEIHVTGGREAVSEIRLRLFVFPEILDVLPTSGPDLLVVVIAGRPRPAEWSATLRAAGFDVLRPPPRSSGGPSPRVALAPRLTPAAAGWRPGRAYHAPTAPRAAA
jgi:hypothetical protein